MELFFDEITHASFFSGQGGFDLASEWMGWTNLLQCEINPFCQQILKYYWKNATLIGDITQSNFSFWRGRIDVLTGGFPCQPYSLAGKRKGKEDDRHLWPQMLRAIREIAPIYVVGENVPGIINWNGGLVFDEVQSDLENEGYEIIPVILPACAKDAPHKRDRVWFIAYSSSHARGKREQQIGIDRKWKIGKQESFNRNQIRFATRPNSYVFTDSNNNGSYGTKNRQSNREGNDCNKTRTNSIKQFKGCCCQTNVANSKKCRRNEVCIKESSGQKQSKPIGICNSGNASNTNSKLSQRRGNKDRSKTSERHVSSSFCIPNWENFPTQSPICSGDDGISSRLDIDTILKTKGGKVNSRFNPFNYWRQESIKAGGNAIVPQVAYEIFKIIHTHFKQTKT